MDQLKALLGKSGVSAELAGAICEEITRLSDSLKKQADEEFKTRIDLAKKVCLEELAKERSSLSRKLKVYLESKARSFEESAARTRKIEEAESATKIRRVAEIIGLGASNADGDLNGQLEAAQKLNSRLEKTLAGLKEQRDVAVTRAKRAYGIAENALQRNRKFETVMSELEITEGELPDFIKKKMEEKKAKKGASASKPAVGKKDEEETTDECAESTQKPEQKKLDESRKVAAKSKAAEPVLDSNQRSAKKPLNESSTASDSRIANIAQAIPEYE